MKRLLVVSLLLAACKEEPPPDPICARVAAAYDAMAKTLLVLAKSDHAGAVALRCGALGLGIRGAPSLVPEELRPRLQPVFDKLTDLAGKCATLGLAATQQQLTTQLASLRTTVVATCAK